jgi:hypothetical protein
MVVVVVVVVVILAVVVAAMEVSHHTHHNCCNICYCCSCTFRCCFKVYAEFMMRSYKTKFMFCKVHFRLLRFPSLPHLELLSVEIPF